MLNAILVERGIARARPCPAHDAPSLLFAGLQGQGLECSAGTRDSVEADAPISEALRLPC